MKWCACRNLLFYRVIRRAVSYHTGTVSRVWWQRGQFCVARSGPGHHRPDAQTQAYAATVCSRCNNLNRPWFPDLWPRRKRHKQKGLRLVPRYDQVSRSNQIIPWITGADCGGGEPPVSRRSQRALANRELENLSTRPHPYSATARQSRRALTPDDVSHRIPRTYDSQAPAKLGGRSWRAPGRWISI